MIVDASAAGGRAVVVDAPAKVNLALHVGPRRPDGYHDIATLFQAIDLCDVVAVRREGRGVSLTCRGEDAGPDEQNLAARAVRAYLAAAGLEEALEPGVHVRLDKRIPVGAGLGGGSSDAAATLRALDRLFDGAVSSAGLLGIASSLGSDVSFFLTRTPLAFGSGRGERLSPLEPHESLPGIVLMPAVRVSTAEAYGTLDRARTSDRPEPPQLEPGRGWDELAARAHNDFEPVVAALHAEIREALAALRATAPKLALLSGSGAACFALHGSARDAERAAATLEGDRRWRAYRVRTLVAWPEPAEA